MLRLYLTKFIPPLPLFSSGYFNGAQFFNNDSRTDQDNAAGGMYIIMGFLWLIGVPVLVVTIVMVSTAHMKTQKIYLLLPIPILRGNHPNM